jgi:hypothetical protein
MNWFPIQKMSGQTLSLAKTKSFSPVLELGMHREKIYFSKEGLQIG